MSTYWPLVAIGLFTGSIWGLGAMGLVLTYKTTGVFNFAYGPVAMFCAYVYWQFHDMWHVTAWVSMPLLLIVVAPVLGLVFEAIFRPLAGLSAEIPLVVGLALLAFFVEAATLIPGWGHGTSQPFQTVIPTSTFKVGTFYVGWDQLGTLVVLALAGVGLWWLLRHTRFGTATRAVVDNRDLASLLGVNGAHVRRAAWVISSMSAGLVAVLLSHDETLTPNALFLVILVATVPAVLGRLVSFPWAVGSSLALGILTSVLTHWGHVDWASNLISAVPWIVLFAGLIVLGPRLKEAGMAVRPLGGRASSDVAVESARRERSQVELGAGLGVGAFVLAVLLPVAVHGPDLGKLTYGAIWALIAVTLVVLTGWAGQVSLCQFSFVGIGAFAVGHLAGAHGANFVGAALGGMAIAVAGAIVVGWAAVRLKGLYLALATLAFALTMDYSIFQTIPVSGGLAGLFDKRPLIAGVSFASTTSYYELCVCVLGVVLGVAFLASRGPVGRRLRILRDSPLAASTLGVNLMVTKLITFAVCGAVAALGGALYGSDLQAITPLDFQFGWSVALLLYVVLMGRTRLAGAALVGLLATIPMFFPNPTVNQALQLGAALGVIGIMRNPEGSIALAIQDARRGRSRRPRPHRQLGVESPLVRAEVSNEMWASSSSR